MDGTLADTMPVHFWAYKNILADYDIDFTPELFASLAGIPATGTIAEVNKRFRKTLNVEEVARIKEQEYEKIMHKMKPIDPVIHLMKRSDLTSTLIFWFQLKMFFVQNLFLILF